MVAGYLLLIFLLFCLFKFVTRKCNWKFMNQILGRIHKWFGIVAGVLGPIHICVTFEVWKTRNVLIIISGFLCIVALVILILTFVYRKAMNQKWMYWHRAAAIILVVGMILHTVSYYMDFFQYKASISQTDIEGISAQGISNGEYIGKYDVGYIKATVQVTVRNEEIIAIKILQHDNERGSSAESIVDEIIVRQNTKVDTVSGATNSSKVLMKAVENALYQP